MNFMTNYLYLLHNLELHNQDVLYCFLRKWMCSAKVFTSRIELGSFS